MRGFRMLPVGRFAKPGGHRRRHIRRKNRADRRHPIAGRVWRFSTSMLYWSDAEVELNAPEVPA